MAHLLAAVNLIYGSNNTASSIASAIIAIIPASISSTRSSRIVYADSNSDGKISVEELVAAIKIAFEDSDKELKTVSHRDY